MPSRGNWHPTPSFWHESHKEHYQLMLKGSKRAVCALATYPVVPELHLSTTASRQRELELKMWSRNTLHCVMASLVIASYCSAVRSKLNRKLVEKLLLDRGLTTSLKFNKPGMKP